MGNYLPFFVFLASMKCIPLGSVKKDFCVKMLLYSTSTVLLFFHLKLANLKISLILKSLVRKKKLNHQDSHDIISQNHFAKKPLGL